MRLACEGYDVPGDAGVSGQYTSPSPQATPQANHEEREKDSAHQLSWDWTALQSDGVGVYEVPLLVACSDDDGVSDVEQCCCHCCCRKCWSGRSIVRAIVGSIDGSVDCQSACGSSCSPSDSTMLSDAPDCRRVPQRRATDYSNQELQNDLLGFRR